MWPHQSPFPLTRMLEVSKHEESKMAENGETADRSSSSSMVIEEELPSFLNALIDKVEQITKLNSSSYEDIHINICELDKTVSLLRTLSHEEDLSNEDKQVLGSLAGAFSDVLSSLQEHVLALSRGPSIICQNTCGVKQVGKPGRPPYGISSEVLEDLLGMGFTCEQISRMFKVSRWTIYRRIRSYGLEHFKTWTCISDEDLDNIVKGFYGRSGAMSGQTFIIGYVQSKGIRVQRSRIRESIARVDPVNTVLRWGMVVSRRKYSVPWPNSLWHLDGHHSLIRWELVIHGCIAGFSRRIIFLKCSSNNKSETVLSYFLEAIDRDGRLWPSRIRVDRGVENVLVCDTMVERHGPNRGSFIAGPSTRNQRIERLWRDVFRCVIHMYYYIFYGMEQSGVLNLNNPINHMFSLQLVFMARINHALHEFTEAFNHHKIRTANNWSPYQMWVNGCCIRIILWHMVI